DRDAGRAGNRVGSAGRGPGRPGRARGLSRRPWRCGVTALLKTERLEAFYGVSQVLHGIDLQLERGEQIPLIGRNGMGKTTLLRSLMGLVADCRGRVTFGGRDIVRAAPEAVARAGVAFVPEGRGVFGSLTVVENLTMAARAGAGGRRSWTLE